MNLIKKFLTGLSSLNYNQDYLCLDKSNHSSLKLYHVNRGIIVKDVSQCHAFIGYNPLIFVFPVDDKASETIKLVFTEFNHSPNEKFHEKDAVAILDLKRIHESIQDFIFYEGIRGRHRFLPWYSQQAVQLNDRMYNRKPGNVFLPGNVLKQVQIAYSIPRVISLITVGQDEKYNLFPTDLHGEVNGKYIISLRHNGKACEQVMSSRSIALSEMPPTAYKSVYHLGKNHMKPMTDISNFSFEKKFSQTLKLPISEEAVRYRELHLTESFIHGIHRIMSFDILNFEEVVLSADTLSHVHNIYATWLSKKGVKSNFLLR